MPVNEVGSRTGWKRCPWTLGLGMLMLLVNFGVSGTPSFGGWLAHGLEFDRQAILDGQVWRLVTGNLVHWSPEHFYLDVGAFLLVGWLYEPLSGRRYPWLLLSAGLAVGVGLLLFLPELKTYRGLSGVDSGQFVGALLIEVAAARGQPVRWLWAAPAATIFLVKILYECGTGNLFFGTESLGDIGTPVPLAHLAGAAAVLVLPAAERLAVAGRGAVSRLLRLAGYDTKDV